MLASIPDPGNIASGAVAPAGESGVLLDVVPCDVMHRTSEGHYSYAVIEHLVRECVATMYQHDRREELESFLNTNAPMTQLSHHW